MTRHPRCNQGYCLERLRERQYPFVVVIGHPEFYPRFGFEPAVAHGLTCEWEVPVETFMVRILNAELGGRLAGGAQYRRSSQSLISITRPNIAGGAYGQDCGCRARLIANVGRTTEGPHRSDHG